MVDLASSSTHERALQAPAAVGRHLFRARSYERVVTACIFQLMQVGIFLSALLGVADLRSDSDIFVCNGVEQTARWVLLSKEQSVLSDLIFQNSP